MHAPPVACALTGHSLASVKRNRLYEPDGRSVLYDVLDVSYPRSRSLAFLGAAIWHRRLDRPIHELWRNFGGYSVVAVCYLIFAVGALWFE